MAFRVSVEESDASLCVYVYTFLVLVFVLLSDATVVRVALWAVVNGLFLIFGL